MTAAAAARQKQAPALSQCSACLCTLIRGTDLMCKSCRCVFRLVSVIHWSAKKTESGICRAQAASAVIARMR